MKISCTVKGFTLEASATHEMDTLLVWVDKTKSVVLKPTSDKKAAKSTNASPDVSPETVLGLIKRMQPVAQYRLNKELTGPGLSRALGRLLSESKIVKQEHIYLNKNDVKRTMVAYFIKGDAPPIMTKERATVIIQSRIAKDPETPFEYLVDNCGVPTSIAKDVLSTLGRHI